MIGRFGVGALSMFGGGRVARRLAVVFFAALSLLGAPALVRAATIRDPVAAAAAPSTPAAAPRAAQASGNANFVGVWKSSAGGWNIETENVATGACTGTSDFSGYTLTDCKVSGNSYVFTVNLGATYHSYNSGTIQGNSVAGSFHDTKGTAQSYTATRLCVVPKLKGLGVAAAKHALQAAHCSVGKVKTRNSANVPKGRVISSSPAAGSEDTAGAKVALKISRGKH